MSFETERLRIRAWHRDDAPRVLDIRSRLDVVKWLGDAVPALMKDLAEAHERIQEWNSREQPPCGYWAIEVKDTGLVAGAVLLVPLPNSEGEVEIAWHLHPDAQGHGYATEAAAAVLRRGFEGGLPEIFALTDVDNYPSQGVCARLGMTDVGTVRKWYEVESRLFRITAEEYAARAD